MVIKYPALAKPGMLGDIPLRNRTVMASLTRNRSDPDTYPCEENAIYYRQRARETGAGLILAEAAYIYPQGSEWLHAPGIYDSKHAQAWRKVVDAVHEEGCAIVCQLHHVGRIAHPESPEQIKSGHPVYAPSPVAARGGKFRHLPGKPGFVTPTQLEDFDMVFDAYENAARCAMEAGFDGVEIHGGNGYLVDEFLSDACNRRTDRWGGSVENRCRFGLEAVKRCIKVWGPKRVGIKLSPCGGYNDMYFNSTEENIATFKHMVTELDKLGIAYIQLSQYNSGSDPMHGGKPQGFKHDVIKTYAHLAKTSKIIAVAEYTAEKANEEVSSGRVEAVAFGTLYMYNPDLYHRIQVGIPLNTAGNVWGHYNIIDGDVTKAYSDYPFGVKNDDGPANGHVANGYIVTNGHTAQIGQALKC